ncbi:MAG: hypothetical protein VX528_04085 [Candidatus Latescibacterota bacterium]|nr:hypothetical protein [Candidatus Latescibacterota bacterium]
MPHLRVENATQERVWTQVALSHPSYAIATSPRRFQFQLAPGEVWDIRSFDKESVADFDVAASAMIVFRFDTVWVDLFDAPAYAVEEPGHGEDIMIRLVESGEGALGAEARLASGEWMRIEASERERFVRSDEYWDSED